MAHKEIIFMKQLIINLRNNQTATKFVLWVVFVFNVYAMIDLFFMNDSFIGVLERLRMFTNISNILAFITVGLFILKQNEKPWYKYLAVISLVAILMTGIIYHALLADPNMSFQNHVVHTINPALYPIFYYLLVRPSIKFYHAWVSLILPLFYFGIILAIGPWTNWYPYNFMDPTLPNASLGSVLVFCLGVLFPVIVVFTLILISLKRLLENAINKGSSN